MSRKRKLVPIVVLIVAVFALLVWYVRRTGVAVLDPAGIVAEKERNLLYLGLGLSAIVVVPVFVLLFTFAWKYREGNQRAKYSPELSGNRAAETVWWLIPSAIILSLSIVAWNSSYALDPYKPLSSQKPLNVQVVALDWKWLFIYPEQQIASVNRLELPVGTPVSFSITSDSVMNSFWIPNLGSQIYAMPGMSTQLNLEASKAGSYPGSSANISGKGFADMAFTAHAVSQRDFNAWLQSAKHSSHHLSSGAYSTLAQPGTTVPTTYYAGVQHELYNGIVAKYMTPGQELRQ